MEAARASEASSFGKYTLVAKLATGGMAEIFLARLLSDGGFEKLVCIKRILSHLAKDPQFVAMFLDEARVVARISHPNVCQVFELGEIEGQYYIAMEYLAGVPLSVFRRADYYPMAADPRLVAAFGVQACDGLHHAHQLKGANGQELGVVHRDISAQNLFVTIDGIVKVLDFGIAKVQDQSVRTSTGAVKGTYAYMAPEQLRGETVDRRADVWALGAVLWETLAQRHLFKRETEFLTFQAITNDPIPDICELRPDVPPLLGDTIARAISRDRDHRFATARAFGEALAQAVGPLGGILGAGAIADEVERAFAGLMDEQRKMLEMARAGDTFDLERSNPLGGAATKLSTTPVSNIKGKLEAAQAEVAHYVRAQKAIRSLEDDEPSATGFTPPPGGQGLYMRAPSERLRRSAPMAAAPPETIIEAVPSGIVRRQSAPMASVTAPVSVHASRLPWIVALVAVLVAGGVAVMFFMNKAAPAPASAAAARTAEPAVVMNTTPPPSRVAAPPVDAAVVTADAARVATAPPPLPPAQKKHEHEPTKVTPKQPPVPAGPPGFITIDSAPVYAVIYIDGKKYGDTPLVNISVPPGRHAVKAVSSSGTTRTLSITIESGKTAPVRRIEW
ncbi:MAG: serine/threonine-protein kinase [Deltaproteobacteria bacterium]